MPNLIASIIIVIIGYFVFFAVFNVYACLYLDRDSFYQVIVLDPGWLIC